jgi:hypothetical protein
MRRVQSEPCVAGRSSEVVVDDDDELTALGF